MPSPQNSNFHSEETITARVGSGGIGRAVWLVEARGHNTNTGIRMHEHSNSSYPHIGDYALIGNGRTAALVARDGSIDWCCWPRIDSPAVFCRLLDARRGGSFRIGPTGRSSVSRAYVGETNVLATVFTTAEGMVRVTDFMPAPDRSTEQEGDPGHLLRRVEGLRGRVELEILFRPTFDYARADTVLTCSPQGAIALSETEALRLDCSVPLQPESDALVGRFTVSADDWRWFALTYHDPRRPVQPEEVSGAMADANLERTLEYWNRWLGGCTYSGPYEEAVHRSALVLKLLTFHPTGGLVAAPTTSLPAEIGGVRNWDYRYTWLRDSALILDALQQIGYHDESLGFFEWLETLCLGCRGDIRIMYTVDGNPLLPERTLDHLEGYRGSRPVRLGNAAADQTQLDVYGHMADAIFLCLQRMPRPIRPELWNILRLLGDRAAARWSEVDQGPWEMRGEPQHFLYSKLYCWVALDRVIRLADQAGLPGNVAAWRHERQAVREAILTQGYNSEAGVFTQAAGTTALDASALVIPLVGFLPATDSRVQSTVERIRQQLLSHGLVYRYRVDDGLPGGEGAFVLCSFWLVCNLAMCGRVGEARELFESVCEYANDVDLLSEAIDPASGELLGNFPQGYAHLGLIRAALYIAHAERELPEANPRREDSLFLKSRK